MDKKLISLEFLRYLDSDNSASPMSIPLIKLQKKNQEATTEIDSKEFEKLFHCSYRKFLAFYSSAELQEVVRLCPYHLRFDWLDTANDKWERHYQKRLFEGAFANVHIQWIDPVLQYGLFASEDLFEKTFIGEYTGRVRRLDQKSAPPNAYCFNYPTRFLSSKSFTIDAMRQGNQTRFINHSEEPNLEALWLVSKRLLHLIFIARRPILKGEQLTFNYGADYWLYRDKVNL